MHHSIELLWDDRSGNITDRGGFAAETIKDMAG